MDLLGRAPRLASPNQTVHIFNQRRQHNIKEQLDGSQLSYAVVPIVLLTPLFYQYRGDVISYKNGKGVRDI